MLTRLIVRKFKRLRDADIELGEAVVFVGPNNSGKTTALQALALWSIGLRKWNEKRKGKIAPEKRPGVTINRKDLYSIPVPSASLLWKDLHFRNVTKADGKQKTSNILIEITVSGITNDAPWTCGFEFDYANEESIYCRPLRTKADGTERMPVPENASEYSIAYLPPMSGLAAEEFRLDTGAVNVRIGEGRTAEVLRNLCYQIAQNEQDWNELKGHALQLFGVEISEPKYIVERGQITMTYKEKNSDGDTATLDLSSSGRGLQQTLLLLAHIYSHPGTVLLLDEPDAHLEILRQRQTYKLLTDVATRHGSQIIAASHSEVILEEASDKDVVVAFVGQPHRIDDRSGGKGAQVTKSLKEIGYDQYFQAELTGWVLYLEGSTDLAILQEFAKKLSHPAIAALERPFVKYVANHPSSARSHFYGLREGKANLLGIAIFDNLKDPLKNENNLKEVMWEKREIENYLVSKEILLRFAESEAEDEFGGPLFSKLMVDSHIAAMEQAIEKISAALSALNKGDIDDPSMKVSDEYLDPLFKEYYENLKLPNRMRKTDYHRIASLIRPDELAPEVSEKLDAIFEVFTAAQSGED